MIPGIDAATALGMAAERAQNRANEAQQHAERQTTGGYRWDGEVRAYEEMAIWLTRTANEIREDAALAERLRQRTQDESDGLVPALEASVEAVRARKTTGGMP